MTASSVVTTLPTAAGTHTLTVQTDITRDSDGATVATFTADWVLTIERAAVAKSE